MHTLLISDNLYLHSIYINENAIKLIWTQIIIFYYNPKSLEQFQSKWFIHGPWPQTFAQMDPMQDYIALIISFWNDRVRFPAGWC